MSAGTSSTLKFLAGGGEMGALIRAKDWSQTPLGPPEGWPQSLRTTLSILLNSRFPMFLWWSDDLIQFYNDAYRPSLGQEGKHPTALGQEGAACWPEIWPVVSPLIDQVRSTREATWSENQLLPIFRNGHLEDVYWTFSYSAVLDESGRVGGVLVVCQETTKRVTAFQRLGQSQQQLQTLFEQAPVGIAILRGPRFVVDLANPLVCEIWGRRYEEVIGRPIFEALPEATEQGFEQLLTRVLQTGEPVVGNELPVRLRRETGVQTVYVNLVFTPWRESDGSTAGVFVVATEVTDSVLARQKIEESENRLSLAIDTAELGTWEYDPQTDVLTCSERAVELVGFAAGETVTQQRALEAVVETDRPRVAEAVAHALRPESGGRYQVEYSLTNYTNGHLRTIQARGQAFFDENGAATRFIGTALDVTEERRAEVALRESDRRFRQLANSVPQIIWTARPDGYLDYFNQQWYDYTGFEEGYGDQSWIPILHPDDVDLCLDAWYHSVRSGEPYRIEYRFVDRRNSDTYRWFIGQAEPLRDDSGQIIKWFGSCTDIDDQKRTEEALRSSDRWFRQLADSMPQIVWTARPDGHLDYFNQRWYDYIGGDRGHGNAGWLPILHPDDRRPCLDQWQHCLQTGEPYRFEFRLDDVRQPGHYRWYLALATAFRDTDNSILKWMGTCTDIHDQKTESERLEKLVQERTESLNQANADLQRTNINLSQFAYVASHDLQEPLRKIQAFGDMLLKRNAAQLDEPGVDRIRRMQDAAGRMSGLIQDLLTYSRVSSFSETFAPVDLTALLASVRSDLGVAIREKSASLRVDALPTLPGDATQLRQLLQNLVSNALKFTRPGVSPVVEVRCRVVSGAEAKDLSLSPDAHFYEISVSDNGIGFEEEYADRIFEAFQRLHGRGDYPGTGIGLAIVRKVAENHHGGVSVSSRVGEGSTFRVYLPVGEGEAEQMVPMR